jgi:hypothetical protein
MLVQANPDVMKLARLEIELLSGIRRTGNWPLCLRPELSIPGT